MNWKEFGTSFKVFAMKLNSKILLWAFLVAGVTLVCFSPVLRGEFLSWDDQALFIDNSYYRGLGRSHWQWMCTTFLLGHWQPLSWLSYAFDYKAWGINPCGWHTSNLLLHTVNAVLVYLLCLAFLKNQNRRYGAATLAALFWAVHPLRVEVAAWLATRGYLLCTTFCLLTVLFYLKAVKQKRYPLAALLCFTFATVTKGIGMMLPPVLLLLDWFPFRRITSVRTAFFCVLEKIPFFALSMLTGIVAFLAKKSNGGMASVEKYGLLERFVQALYGTWFYLLKTVSPVNLSLLYDKRPEHGLVMVSLVLTAAVAIAFFLLRRRLRPALVTFGVFLLLIFPMLGFTQSGAQLFADRFTYLAAISFSVLLSAGMAKLSTVCRMIYGALIALLLLFSVQTFIYSVTWSDSLMIWHCVAERNGDNPRAYNGMGQALMDRKVYVKAIECFNQALLLQPGYAAALQNRALARVAIGEYKEAIADVSQALATEGLDKTDRVKMLIGRGRIAEKTGNPEQALADYSAVIEDLMVDPVWKIRVLQMRGLLHLELGKRAEGKADLESTLELPDPDGECWKKSKQVINELKKIPEE